MTRIDRLARSTFGLFALVKQIVDAKAQFRSLAEPWADTGTSTGRLMLAVLGGLAEFERDLIRARTGEGRSPRDPGIGRWYLLIGTAHLLQSRMDEAIAWFEKARTAMPAVPFHHSLLASAYALKGETEGAAAELAEARRLRGEGSFSSITKMKANGYFGVPKTRALFETTYFAGLRQGRDAGGVRPFRPRAYDRAVRRIRRSIRAANRSNATKEQHGLPMFGRCVERLCLAHGLLPFPVG